MVWRLTHIWLGVWWSETCPVFTWEHKLWLVREIKITSHWPQIPSGFSPHYHSHWSQPSHCITGPPPLPHQGRWPAHCPPHVAIVGCNAICDYQRSLSLSRLHSVIRASGSSCHWHCVHSLAGLAWAGLSGLSAESRSVVSSVSLSHSPPCSKFGL